MEKNIRMFWNEKAQNLLIGKKIIAVKYMEQEQAADSYWSKCPVMIMFDDNTIMIPQSDDEGNDGGVLMIGNELLPTLQGE